MGEDLTVYLELWSFLISNVACGNSATLALKGLKVKNGTKYYIVSLVNSSVQSTVYIVMKLIECLKILLTALLIPSKLSSLFFRLKLMQCKFCKFTHTVEAVLLKNY